MSIAVGLRMEHAALAAIWCLVALVAGLRLPVIAAPLLADRIGVVSLAIGILLGSLAQLALMCPNFLHSIQ